MQKKRFRRKQSSKPLQVKTTNIIRSPHNTDQYQKEVKNKKQFSELRTSNVIIEKPPGQRLNFIDEEICNSISNLHNVDSENDENDTDEDVIKISDFKKSNRNPPQLKINHREKSLEFDEFIQPPDSTSTPTQSIANYDDYQPIIPGAYDTNGQINPPYLPFSPLMVQNHLPTIQGFPCVFPVPCYQHTPNPHKKQKILNNFVPAFLEEGFDQNSPLVKKTIEKLEEKTNAQRAINLPSIPILPIYYPYWQNQYPNNGNVPRSYVTQSENPRLIEQNFTLNQNKSSSSQDSSNGYSSSGGNATYKDSK